MRDRDGRRRDGRGKPRDGMNQTNGGGTECDNAVDQLTDTLTLLQFQFPPMKRSFPLLLLLLAGDMDDVDEMDGRAF